MARRHTRSTHHRNQRLADQIRQDLAVLIQRELPMSQVGLVTLTRVELTPDYAHAKVYFTVMGAEPEVAGQLLNDRAGWLHAQLFKMLHIHTVPRLQFLHDAGLVHGYEVNQLIERAKRLSEGSDADVDQADEPENPGSIPDAPDEPRG